MKTCEVKILDTKNGNKPAFRLQFYGISAGDLHMSNREPVEKAIANRGLDPKRFVAARSIR